MDHAERQRRRIARSAPGIEPRDRPFQEQQQQDSQRNRQRWPDSAADDGSDPRPGQQGERAGHEGSVRHHHRSRHVVSADASRMVGEHVQPPVADAELLAHIAARILAPSMDADGRRQNASRYPASLKTVAQVVVRPVAEALVEQADTGGARSLDRPYCRCRHDRRSLRRCLRSAARDRVPSRGPRSSRGRWSRSGPVPRRRWDPRAPRAAASASPPKDDVLIDLADDRMLRSRMPALTAAANPRRGPSDPAKARPLRLPSAAAAIRRVLPSSTAMISNGRPSRCASIPSITAASQRRPL